MNKLFFLTLFFIFFNGFLWDYKHEFKLSKDEVAVLKITNREDKSVRDMLIRWTLYTNDRLVLLLKYDSFVTQYILQKEYKRNSIRINLRDDYASRRFRSYLILTFKEFSNAKAILKVSVSDPKKRVLVDFIDPQK